MINLFKIILVHFRVYLFARVLQDMQPLTADKAVSRMLVVLLCAEVVLLIRASTNKW